MAKFHVNPTTGDAGACSATQGPCPFGGEEAHHSSLAEAREAFESSQLVNQISLRRTPSEWEKGGALGDLGQHVEELRSTFSADAGGGSENDLTEYLDDYLVERWHYLSPANREHVKQSIERELGTAVNFGTEEDPAWVWESNQDFYKRCAG